MRYCNLTRYVPLAKLISLHPPQPEMMVLVRASYRLDADGSLSELREPRLQGPLRRDVFAEGGGECLHANDLAAFKLRAEVLVEGHCYAPGGQPTAQCPIQVAVGGWRKQLLVTGKRRWQAADGGHVPSAPEPFARMPLLYRHAFGGAGHAANPVGVGLADNELPSIEYPHALMRTPSDRPPVAGFGPIHPGWSSRAQKLGRTQAGAAVDVTAEGFDWSYFNAAPEDQQLNGYLRGDEELSILNLHPDAEEVHTRLPGRRVRVLALDDQDELREVPMVLDTLLLELDQRRLQLSWRGFTPVRTDDLVDIQALLVVAEPLNAPRQTMRYYRARLEAFVPESVIAQYGSGAVASGISGVSPAPRVAEIPSRGQTARGAWTAPTPAAPGPAASPQAAPPAVARPAGVRPPHAAAVTMRQVASTPPAASPVPAAQQEGFGPGCDLRERDLSGRDFSGMDLSGACFDMAVLSRADFRGCNLSGASFHRAVLLRANLGGADLRGATLTNINGSFMLAEGANLDETKLDRANLQDADLRGVSLAGASGKEVQLARARLSGAQGQGVRLPEAMLQSADLSGASFEGAFLNDASLEEVRGAGVNLSGAQLQSARLRKAHLQEAQLAGIRAPSSMWPGALLDGADLSGALLSNADFSRASASGSSWSGADLREARLYRLALMDADLEEANMVRVEARKADLSRARLVRANLTKANLQGARTHGANLQGAVLDGCTMEADGG